MDRPGGSRYLAMPMAGPERTGALGTGAPFLSRGSR